MNFPLRNRRIWWKYEIDHLMKWQCWHFPIEAKKGRKKAIGTSTLVHLGFCSVVDVSKGYLRHHINGLSQWALVTAAANPHKRQHQSQTSRMIFHTFIIWLSDSYLHPKWRNSSRTTSFINCLEWELYSQLIADWLLSSMKWLLPYQNQ